MSTPFLNDDALAAAAAWGALLACLLAWSCWAAIALMAVWPGMFGKPSARPAVLVNLAALVSIAAFTSILLPKMGIDANLVVGAAGLILTFAVVWERVTIQGEQITVRKWGRPPIVIRFEEIASVRWRDEPRNSDSPSAKTEIIKRDGSVVEISLRGPVRLLERILRQHEISIEGSPRQAFERELVALLFLLSLWLLLGVAEHYFHLLPFV